MRCLLSALLQFIGTAAAIVYAERTVVVAVLIVVTVAVEVKTLLLVGIGSH